MTALGTDVHSYSNFSDIIITHLYPHLSIDFNRGILYGYTDLTLQTIKTDTPTIHYVRFDIRGLCIEYVNLVDAGAVGAVLPWTIPHYDKHLGSCLEVDLSQVKKEDTPFVIRVYYSTSRTLSGGIQWFTPEQTKGKKYPFVYTQFEAILARTMIPCQDTPAVKAPYSIEITCPSPLVVVCSGLQVGTPVSSFPHADGKEWLTYKFEQKMPIPSYLIALACGDIQRRVIGPRTGVWAEGPLLDAAAYEFAETEKLLDTASKIAGLPYEPLWGHYDLLVLPGAFPYGGMENPNLTFISSSLITGDRALVDVVAHEISHSWSGNLVSNSNWGDFWLNEGFTMYLERLIIGELHGEQIRHLHAYVGYQDLQKTFSDLAKTPEYQKLRPDLTGVDPDRAFSRVPYEKGFLLLFHLEKLVGGKDRMIEWLRKYFLDFSRKSINTDQMIAHFTDFFHDTKVDWNSWLHEAGLPTGHDPTKGLDNTLFSACKQLADRWETNEERALPSDLSWQPAQTMCFIDILINTQIKLSTENLKKMQDVYKLSDTKNVEVLFRWIMLNLQNLNITYIIPVVEDFVSKHGRGVYLNPIYNTLIKLGEEGTLSIDDVKRIYRKNHVLYHSVITNNFNERLL